MIIIDTHIWIWWIHGDAKLSLSAVKTIQANESKEIGVSVITC